MNETQAIMITATTYGSWLRGDDRGWVEDGVTWPRDPELQSADLHRMKHPPFRFETEQLRDVRQFIGGSLHERQQQRILALTVQTWHVHIVIAATKHPLPKVVKCLKDAVRWGLRPDRPIWTDGYDKRFCFDDESVRHRIEYAERHNIEMGWDARPWSFIERPEF